MDAEEQKGGGPELAEAVLYPQLKASENKFATPPMTEILQGLRTAVPLPVEAAWEMRRSNYLNHPVLEDEVINSGTLKLKSKCLLADGTTFNRLLSVHTQCPDGSFLVRISVRRPVRPLCVLYL